MKQTKSPFLIYDNIISPLLCEEIIANVGFPIPTSNEDSTVNISSTTDSQYEELIYNKIEQLIPSIEQYFKFKHKGTTQFNFEWIPQSSYIPIRAENSEYINNSWVRTKARDFTAILFLSEYNETPDFDSDFECCGGCLEFVNHDFSIHPSRGSLVIFPCDPRFSNATSLVKVGDAYQIRFHFVASDPWLYQPSNFPGDLRTWF